MGCTTNGQAETKQGKQQNINPIRSLMEFSAPKKDKEGVGKKLN